MTVSLLWSTPLLALCWVTAGVSALLAAFCRGVLRVVAVNLLVISSMVLVAETALAWRSSGRGEPSRGSVRRAALPPGETWQEVPTFDGHRAYIAGTLMNVDAAFGPCNLPNARAREIRFAGDSLVYDVEYRTDALGLRTTAPSLSRPDSDAPAILIFGCSFVFGQGVPSEATTASLIQQSVGARARVLNLGVNGAGPHDMLAMIESGFVDRVLAGRPVARVFYGAMHHHVQRVIGRVPWAAGYPRYVLRGDVPVRDGSFEQSDALGGDAWRWARRSPLLSAIPRLLVDEPRGTDLFVRLLIRAAELIRQKYDTELIVFSWSSFRFSEGRVFRDLAGSGIPAHHFQEVFPDFSPQTHWLPHYNHPNARANRELADFLTRTYPLPRR